MNLMLLTSQRIVKVISLLIVSTFLFVQIASASHVHVEPENSPEPEVCAICLAPTQDDDDDEDNDLPPSPPVPFVIPNTLDLHVSFLTDARLVRDRHNVSTSEPPNLRLSAPRAPPA